MKKSKSRKISIGLPLMHLEQGEKRCFLPKLVHALEKNGGRVFLEHGYGASMGLKPSDYKDAAPGVRFSSNEEVFQKEIVLVLRCPSEESLRKMRPGTCLISMLHYGTRPKRVALLHSLNVCCISLDAIKDDSGRRLVENFQAVAWNGMEAAFQMLQKTYPAPGFFSPKRQPIQITLLGAGALGAHTVRAAVRYGNDTLHQKLASEKVPGVIVTAVDYDITNHAVVMRNLLAKTDILVDASARVDTTKAIISNKWLAHLPQYAVILDLCVDPYQQVGDVFHTKGIEGIPQGNLDQYTFSSGDPVYKSLPKQVPTSEQRHTVTCYSWPGIHPKECMEVYGQQLQPIMRILVRHGGLKGIKPKGRFFERAINRSLLPNQKTRPIMIKSRKKI